MKLHFLTAPEKSCPPSNIWIAIHGCNLAIDLACGIHVMDSVLDQFQSLSLANILSPWVWIQFLLLSQAQQIWKYQVDCQKISTTAHPYISQWWRRYKIKDSGILLYVNYLP